MHVCEFVRVFVCACACVCVRVCVVCGVDTARSLFPGANFQDQLLKIFQKAFEQLCKRVFICVCACVGCGVDGCPLFPDQLLKIFLLMTLCGTCMGARARVRAHAWRDSHRAGVGS